MLPGVVISEWTKLRSVRSTYLTLLAAVAATLFVGFLVTDSAQSHWATWTAQQRAAFDPVNDSLVGGAVAQLAFGVLGVLVIGSEYTTGAIRTTFAAVPRRRRVLLAKIATAGALSLVIGEALCFVTFFVGQAVLSAKHLDVSLPDPGVLRAVSGAGFFMFTITVSGLALGAIIRRTAGAIAALFGFIYILPPIFHALPDPWNRRLSTYALDTAVQAMTATTAHQAQAFPAPLTGLLVCLGYLAVLLCTAFVLVTRRDA